MLILLIQEKSLSKIQFIRRNAINLKSVVVFYLSLWLIIKLKTNIYKVYSIKKVQPKNSRRRNNIVLNGSW